MKYTAIEKINLLANIYAGMFGAIFRFRAWSGFFFIALFQAMGLYALTKFYLPGLFQILFPVISYFVPGIMMHYPQYYIALPSIYSTFDNFILGPTVWVIFSAYAVYKLEGYYREEKASAGEGIKKAFGAYFPLLMFWALETGLVLLVIALPSKLAAGIVVGSPGRGLAMKFGLQILAFTISAFLVYTIPAMILGARCLGAAIRESIGLCCRNFFLTFFLVSIPGVIKVILDILLSEFSPRIIQFLNPEIIPLALGLQIIIGIFINLFIYGAAVFVYREMA